MRVDSGSGINPHTLLKGGKVAGGEVILEASGIHKHFGGTKALSNVDFSVTKGEIHGLVGANGAGKSTLVKVLAGVYRPEAGEIRVDGATVEISSVERARELGMCFVHQQHVIVPSLTGLENVLLGEKLPLRRSGLINWRAAGQRGRELMETSGFEFDLRLEAGRQSAARQKLIEIARALAQRAQIVVLDEPTASLGDEEVGHLMSDLRSLADSGVSIVYISHRLEEVVALSDRITVLRNGMNAGIVRREEATKARVVEMIVGGATDYSPPSKTRSAGPELLACEDVCWGDRVKGVSLSLHAGEVVGLAGLEGSGRTELARLLFGVNRPASGVIRRNGEVVHWKSSADAIRSGVAMVPEDRHIEGLVEAMSISKNVTLPSLRDYRLSRGFPFLNHKKETATAKEQITKLAIRAGGPNQAVSELSGGNQQKVVLARWLARNAEVLILDEPTHGVDVGAKSEIYRLISELAAAGAAVLIIASELIELVETCDRVVVLYHGKIASEVGRSELSEDLLLSRCFGHVTEQPTVQMGAS